MSPTNNMAMTQSYRNVKGHHSVAIHGGASGSKQTQGTIYEKLRNSYQSPSNAQYITSDMMNSTGTHFNTKSPKMGYKQIKVAQIGGVNKSSAIQKGGKLTTEKE